MYCPLQVLSFFLLLATSLAAVSSLNTEVCRSFDSGDRTLVSYPFWTSPTQNFTEQNSFCGYRPLEVTCQGGAPTMVSGSGASFIVKKINQTARTVRLVDSSIGDSSCPKAGHNINVKDDFPSMSYSPSTVILHFFHSCYSSSLPKENKANCFRDATGESYIFVDNDMGSLYIDRAYLYCRSWTLWPVMREVIMGRDVVSVFPEAMRKGFELEWSSSGDGGQCSGCEVSHGQCVYTNRTGESTFRCRCADDTWSTGDCGDEGVPSFCLILGISGVVFYIYAKFWKKQALEEIAMIGQTIETFLEMNGPIALKRYKYWEVRSMSNSFLEKLGTGGQGTVYKGKLPSGIPIAIKMLNSSKASGEEFLNEVVAIGRTSHKNVVSLLGFCFEGTKRALIYEFMANGSLEKFLFHNKMDTMMPLSWDKLYKIALGIARGLDYLHGGCKTSIVHFDIKPHNILLDDELSPKISDFGLAKLFSHRQMNFPMVYARGTIGYIAPELFSREFGHVSSKSDVYSYGMLILEMVGKRRNFKMQVQNPSEVYFPHWIYDHLGQQKDLEAYGIVPEIENIAKKMIIIGLCCIQTNPTSRPSISRVVEMLEGDTADLQIPSKPYLCSPPRRVLDSINVSNSS